MRVSAPSDSFQIPHLRSTHSPAAPAAPPSAPAFVLNVATVNHVQAYDAGSFCVKPVTDKFEDQVHKDIDEFLKVDDLIPYQDGDTSESESGSHEDIGDAAARQQEADEAASRPAEKPASSSMGLASGLATLSQKLSGGSKQPSKEPSSVVRG